MNSNGLLYKTALNTLNTITPTFLYRTPKNGYITLLDIYVAGDPSLVTNITLYLSKQVIVPANYDAIIVDKPLNGSIILNSIEAGSSEALFIAATNTSNSGSIAVQVRGRTQITPLINL